MEGGRRGKEFVRGWTGKERNEVKGERSLGFAGSLALHSYLFAGADSVEPNRIEFHHRK